MPWSPRLQASERGQGPGVRGEGMHALIAALVTQDPALRRLMRCDPHSISSLYYRPTLNPAPTLLTGWLAPHSFIHSCASPVPEQRHLEQAVVRSDVDIGQVDVMQPQPPARKLL